jgi:formylglycine-generating enzyme required for sulfatase activity
MGDKGEGQVRVTLTRGFWMGETPVTQALWVAVMGANPSHFRSALSGAMPVEMVSWGDSISFVNELSRLQGLRPVYGRSGPDVSWDQREPGFRLPTEAEWEYAARAEQGFKYAGSDDAEMVVWFDKNSGARPHPVGCKAPNAWGLRDISGNVYEWCWDRDGDYPLSDLVDPAGPSRGLCRAVRGGSWLSSLSDVRVSFRNCSDLASRFEGLGLRLVRTGS